MIPKKPITVKKTLRIYKCVLGEVRETKINHALEAKMNSIQRR